MALVLVCRSVISVWLNSDSDGGFAPGEVGRGQLKWLKLECLVGIDIIYIYIYTYLLGAPDSWA